MTDSPTDFPVDDSTPSDVAADQLDALDEQLGDDVSIEDLDVELENEYWVDYNHSHHGIVFCWRNNLKQVLLAVEETISPTQESTGFDIVLMNSEGGYISQLETVEDEEEALQKALEYQNQYPQGEFPQLEDYDPEAQSGPSRGWMIDDNPLYEDDSDSKEKPESVKSSESSGLVGWLRSVFSR